VHVAGQVSNVSSACVGVSSACVGFTGCFLIHLPLLAATPAPCRATVRANRVRHASSLGLAGLALPLVQPALIPHLLVQCSCSSSLKTCVVAHFCQHVGCTHPNAYPFASICCTAREVMGGILQHVRVGSFLGPWYWYQEWRLHHCRHCHCKPLRVFGGCLYWPRTVACKHVLALKRVLARAASFAAAVCMHV
jgi:hypothetical protein